MSAADPIACASIEILDPAGDLISTITVPLVVRERADGKLIIEPAVLPIVWRAIEPCEIAALDYRVNGEVRRMPLARVMEKGWLLAVTWQAVISAFENDVPTLGTIDG